MSENEEHVLYRVIWMIEYFVNNVNFVLNLIDSFIHNSQFILFFSQNADCMVANTNYPDLVSY